MKNKLAKKFAGFLKETPDAELLRFCKTQDQVDRWFQARKTNTVVADCFSARFSGGDDPIAEWQGAKTSDLAYQIAWRTVDLHESLWGMVQLSFRDIREAFAEGSQTFPFPKAWDLFLEIVKLTENVTYAKCLEPSCNTVNLKRDAAARKLIRKEVWSGLSEEETIKLQGLVETWGYNPWLHVVYKSCGHLSKSKPLIAQKFKDFRQNIAIVSDLQLKLYSEASKGRLDIKLKSQNWVDGKRLEGQQHSGAYS